MEQPLAERMRPQKLHEVVGQEHLLGENKLITRLVKAGKPFSLIFWGPPGSGKTTLARIIASELDAEFIELSAVTAGKADVSLVIERAKRNAQLPGARGSISTNVLQLQSPTARPARATVLFIDEIHRFNKAQQDTFLPHVESGLITLIGATTENPSFEVITPLLSRSRVVVLEPLTKEQMIEIVSRAAQSEKLQNRLSPDSINLLAELSGGDARVALSNLELAAQLTKGKISPQIIESAAQQRVPGYDKAGENHYNIISAFIKSLRGSQPSAALYYMARMLQAGEDPKFIARRMVIFASEDIGLAAPAALNLAVSAFLAVERIGLPECQYNLFHCASVLAKAPKSREVASAMGRAQSAARQYPDLPVPLHLRNAPTKLMKDLGYGKDYKWQADFKHKEGFLPPELKNTDFFKN
jgi:putative ATPase